MAAAGVRVVEVDRSDRQDRRRAGKSDPLDAVSTARAAQSGRARGAPKGRDGAVEAIRALMVAKRSARAERTQTNGQARSLILTGPEDLRARFAGYAAAGLVAGIALLRPRPGDAAGYATRFALREPGRRAEFPGGQIERLDDLIVPLVAARAPGLMALYGVGPETAALLLVAAGDHPERLRSEAAWAHLCAVAPIPASSGKRTRHRLNRGGDRQANHALWRIVITRMSSHPPLVPTSSGAPQRGCRRRKSSAASSVTSPARSTPSCADPPADTSSRGRPGPRIGCRNVLAFERSAGRPRAHHHAGFVT